MKNDIDENGLNSFNRVNKKALETMRNTFDNNGINIIESRNLKAVQSIKNNIGYENISLNASITKFINKSNSAETFWKNISDDEKVNYIKLRNETTRQTNDKNGRWRPIEDIDDYELYFQRASIKHGFETNNEDEKKLLKEFGIFNNLTNTKGCVRDHLLSRRFGFENNIPVWIISHPANCEIILHSENVRRMNICDNQITLDDLLLKIKNYSL